MRRAFVVSWLAWLAGCGGAQPEAAPVASPPVVEVPEASAAVAPSGAVDGDVEEGGDGSRGRKLVVMKQLMRMVDCGHDGAVGELRCAYGATGEDHGVGAEQRLVAFVTEPPGLVLANVDFDPAEVVEGDAVAAQCDFEERGALRDVHLGAVRGVEGFVYAGEVEVGVARGCTFEPFVVPTLTARHVLVMHDKSLRGRPSITRSREEALQLARELALRVDTPLAELAQTYSDEPGASKRGGNLGTFRAKVMVPEFILWVMATPVGGRSPAVETSFGFHVIERR